MNDRVGKKGAVTTPEISASSILSELQSSGVYDNMRAQVLHSVVDKVKSTYAEVPVKKEQEDKKTDGDAAVKTEKEGEENAETTIKKEEEGFGETVKKEEGEGSAESSEKRPESDLDAFQKRVREVAQAALNSAELGMSKGDILKRMRAAVEADGSYIALSKIVDDILENDEEYQSQLFSAVHNATSRLVHPPKRAKLDESLQQGTTSRANGGPV